MDVIENGNLFRYGTPGVDGFQGKVALFEKEMAERLGHKHLVATSSGTGSLMCCLAAPNNETVRLIKPFIYPGFRSFESVKKGILPTIYPRHQELS